jgi:hypothetical protein
MLRLCGLGPCLVLGRSWGEYVWCAGDDCECWSVRASCSVAISSLALVWSILDSRDGFQVAGMSANFASLNVAKCALSAMVYALLLRSSSFTTCFMVSTNGPSSCAVSVSWSFDICRYTWLLMRRAKASSPNVGGVGACVGGDGGGVGLGVCRFFVLGVVVFRLLCGWCAAIAAQLNLLSLGLLCGAWGDVCWVCVRFVCD